MANSTDEVWSFANPYYNGGSPVSLNQYGWSIATIGGSRFGIPTLRGQNIEVPYRAGQQQVAKFPDQRTIALIMFTAGIDNTTEEPGADQRLTWNNNWQSLRQLFWSRGPGGSVQGTLTRQWYITQNGSPGLVSASALAEVAGSMDPAMTGRFRADFTVDLLLADPYFYGNQQTQTLSYNSAAAVVNLGEGVAGESYAGSVSGFTLQFNGPLTSPVLTNETAGVSVSLGASIASGHYVLVDVLNDTAVTDAAVNAIADITHAGSRMWMCLLPGSNTLKLTSGNGGDTGTCLLTWNPPYV